MDALSQRLKELDPDAFQKLCFELISERYPGAGVRYVEGAAGDEGIDLLVGSLKDGPTVWQCKAFTNGIRESQKNQIRESLKRVVKAISPRLWILCISVNMDLKTLKWWERYKASWASKVKIELFCASDIVRELMYRTSIRNHFFPGAVIDALLVQQTFQRTGQLTSEQLHEITERNLDQYIEQLKEADARFHYKIVHEGEMGPSASHDPGLMMSVYRDRTTIKVYPRDVEALKQNPPKLSLRVKGEGVGKFKELLKRGTPQQFEATEFEVYDTTFPLTEDLKNLASHRLIVQTSPDTLQKTIPVRMVFKTKTTAVEYGYLELGLTRAGTDEIEIRTKDKFLPFVMTLQLALGARKITFGLEERLEGVDIQELHKYFGAYEMLRIGGELEIVELRTGKPLFATPCAKIDHLKERAEIRELVGRIARICNAFRLKLRMPTDFSDDDFFSLFILESLLARDSVPLDTLTVALVKSETNKDQIGALAEGPGQFRIESNFYNPPPVLLGVPVNTGPCAITVPHYELAHKKEFLTTWRQSKIGDSVPMTLNVIRPAVFELLHR